MKNQSMLSVIEKLVTKTEPTLNKPKFKSVRLNLCQAVVTYIQFIRSQVAECLKTPQIIEMVINSIYTLAVSLGVLHEDGELVGNEEELLSIKLYHSKTGKLNQREILDGVPFIDKSDSRFVGGVNSVVSISEESKNKLSILMAVYQIHNTHDMLVHLLSLHASILYFKERGLSPIEPEKAEVRKLPTRYNHSKKNNWRAS